LLALTVLPLYVPVLIFGVSAVEGELRGLGGRAGFLILGALPLAARAPCPPAAALGWAL
jgi:heme exporter protein B